MLTDPSQLLPRSHRRPRLRVLWCSVIVAAVMHWCLLGTGDVEIGVLEPSGTVAAMQVRDVPAPMPSHAVPTPVPVVQRSHPRASIEGVAAPLAEPAPSVASSGAIETPSELAAIPADTELVNALAMPAGPTEVTVPVYRTEMPPAATLHYELRKGSLSGSGELAWKPAADRYEARLEGSVAGMNLITQISVGVFDANGLAPLRYTDTRSRRAANAANFQRDKGKITYSGPQVEYPLIPGAQDRVSWMIQIGAILNADPKLATPDGKISMFVSGASGDADLWVFRYVGAETLRSDSGPLHTVKFTREPRKVYDRSVEVWLAPTRHHLPVRARFTATAGGDIFELLLRDIQSP
ncbi:MAG: DUF3108 domain-containing protein [Burkholderiales bacterium]|nr:DUF3108 domain-containing protein [Burkholderiales bacterium]